MISPSLPVPFCLDKATARHVDDGSRTPIPCLRAASPIHADSRALPAPRCNATGVVEARHPHNAMPRNGRALKGTHGPQHGFDACVSPSRHCQLACSHSSLPISHVANNIWLACLMQFVGCHIRYPIECQEVHATAALMQSLL